MSNRSVPLSVQIGERLRSQRQRLGLRQLDLAEGAEISIEMVSRLERGRCLPSVPTLLALCRVLHVTPNQLLGIEASPPEPTRYASLRQLLSGLSDERVQDVERIAETFVRYEKR